MRLVEYSTDDEDRVIYQFRKVQIGGNIHRFDPPVMNMQKPPVCCVSVCVAVGSPTTGGGLG